jgi:hypothetical protein
MTDNHPERVRVQIRLKGHLDQRWSDWFAGLTLAHEPGGTTTLRGSLTDQAQLYGVLAQVRDLGATLISLNPLGDHTVAECDPPCGPSCPF